MGFFFAFFFTCICYTIYIKSRSRERTIKVSFNLHENGSMAPFVILLHKPQIPFPHEISFFYGKPHKPTRAASDVSLSESLCTPSTLSFTRNKTVTTKNLSSRSQVTNLSSVGMRHHPQPGTRHSHELTRAWTTPGFGVSSPEGVCRTRSASSEPAVSSTHAILRTDSNLISCVHVN